MDKIDVAINASHAALGQQGMGLTPPASLDGLIALAS